MLFRTFLRPSRLAPVATFLAGLAFITAGVVVSARLDALDARTQFEAEVERATQATLRRVETYIAMLRGGAGLFVASADVEPGEFRAYVEQLHLEEMYRGIQGIGFAERSGDGYPITLLEPLDRRNQAAIGYDMFSDPVRRAAMECARDTAAPCASGAVTLVQEIDEEKQAGFLIYLPVYEGGIVPVSLDDRRRAITGFIYAPFRAGDLLGTLVPQEPDRPLELEVFDEAESGRRTLLFATAGTGRAPVVDRRITVAGRTWVLRFAPGTLLEARQRSSRWPFYLTGALAAGLIAWLVFLNLHSREARLEHAERLNEQLRRTDQLKDEFLATLSHELRTPLHAILGWTLILKNTDLDQATRARAIDTIERSTRAQAALVDDVLDVSRIIRGKLKLELRPVDMGGVVRDAIESVRPSADAKRLQLSVAEDGPPAILTADRDRLQQVVWNLLANAVKFTPEGGRIDVRIKRGRDRVRLEVRDTGIGVTPEFLPHIFERFRQSDASAARAFGGLGLGLAIVRHVVESHGGTVSAASEGLGKGTQFTVDLPLRTIRAEYRGNAGDRLEPTGANTAGARADRLAGIRVLVVDDDPDGLEAVAAWLAHAGAEVRTARSGPSALEVLDAWTPDVILSDVGMPGMDGWEFLRNVRARGSARGGDVPAAALTAYAQQRDRARSHDSGFQLHLAKPVDPKALVAAVSELARQARRWTR